MMKPRYSKAVLASSIAGVLALSGITTAGAGERKFTPADFQTVSYELEADMADETDGIYLVRLTDPAIAVYDGGLKGLQPTSAQATGKKRLDTKSKAAQNYKKHLEQQQEEVLDLASSTLNRDLDAIYRYQYATNGFAVELTVEEAKAMRGLPGVVSVQRERMEQLLTDSGPAWIDAPSIWNNKPAGTLGEGVVIAVLDTGINSDHPSFADIGGDGYDHKNPMGSGNYVPGSYCDVVDGSFCNDKLIGAWDMVASDGNIPEDNDGHGSHTASTAAGNFVYNAELVAPTTSASFNISGVAPHANIIAYDVCDDGCPGSSLAAAIDQVLVDAGNLPNGIAALNYSISGGGNPYSDYVELGFLAAVQAGVYVAASAGNSGPAASTVAHLGPWVSTTAASTHNRTILNSLVDLTSSGGGTPDITGKGFTGGYGPAPIINSADLEGTYPGATLCGVGPDDGDTNPFPPNTFSGEIVACTRGTYGRVEKGQNVLDAGAGGYILMDNGAGLVGDAHVLPAVHISAADSAVLSAWLAANAGNSPMATIAGYEIDEHPGNGDVMAGFSSRGPQLVFDVLKPDITAPGVDIMGAEADGQGLSNPEYQFLSGTSMSSPHNAGAGALLTAMRPDLTPQEIKSALMMSSTTEFTVKEDGFTPTDPFDLGAGRIDLHAAKQAGLVLNETTANFLAADPNAGGDPSTLNVASMMNSNCVGTCSWTREVRNPEKSSSHWNVGTSAPAEIGLSSQVTPQANSDDYNLMLKKNQKATIEVVADTGLAPEGWYFGTLDLDRNLDKGPDLHMPVAVYAGKATNPGLFTKTVDEDTAEAGDVLNYEIKVVNGPLDGVINISDLEPAGATFIEGTETVNVVNGSTINPVTISGGELTWSGTLDTSDIDVLDAPFAAPFGYIPLPLFVAPMPCSSVCDDTSINITGLPAFRYNGNVYTSIRMGSNGILIPGSASAGAFTANNQDFPDPTAPNPIAPFWTDIDMDGTSPTDSGAGIWYSATALGGAFTILEWNNVQEWNVPGVYYTVQVQIGNIGSGYEGIWFVYDRIDGVPTSGLTVGAESPDGQLGNSRHFDGAGPFPVVGGAGELVVAELPAGEATINFQATANCGGAGIVNEAVLEHDGDTERAIAGTVCE